MTLANVEWSEIVTFFWKLFDQPTFSNQIENPKAMDGYIHYNFKERSLVSNLSRMSRYGKIYDGKNLSKKINLIMRRSKNL